MAAARGASRRRRRARPAQPDRPLEYRLLLTATMCLLAGGAVMVYSASSATDLLSGAGDGTSYPFGREPDGAPSAPWRWTEPRLE